LLVIFDDFYFRPDNEAILNTWEKENAKENRMKALNKGLFGDTIKGSY
jgi:hypothetical protein